MEVDNSKADFLDMSAVDSNLVDLFHKLAPCNNSYYLEQVQGYNTYVKQDQILAQQSHLFVESVEKCFA